MVRRLTPLVLLAFAAGSTSAGAQAPLSVSDAIARGRARNAEVRAAAAGIDEAAAREAQARAAYLPRVDASESWQRGNQPVFVFSSLLGQRRFSAADFAIDALNHPSAIGNFRSTISIEQPLFDAGARAAAHAARAGADIVRSSAAQATHDLDVDITVAFGRVLLAEAQLKASESAIAAASADRARAAARRDAGLVTSADVLQFDLHVARARAARIRADADLSTSRAALNALMGEPLDARFTLQPMHEETAAAPDVEALEQAALAHRPAVAAARAGVELAIAERASARAGFLPQVSAQALWEWNGGRFDDRSSSWAGGITARINLFRGFADRARVAEAEARLSRRRLELERAETAARLDVRNAVSAVAAARAQLDVIRAAYAQAREARRIIRDRYENGLADVAALLRAAEAEESAATAQLSAEIDLAVAAASLTRAVGKS